MTDAETEGVAKPDWVIGDILGLTIPAHADALRAGGVAFLTAAFRASGALAPTDSVARISQCDEWTAGGTGRKLLLSVAYTAPTCGLPTDLFVKFSRHFDDPIRDAPRFHMEAEVRLASLSRTRGFPVAVPLCLFADFHHASGTGILITQRVPFGRDPIERHYLKCQDYEMPEQLAHYRALMRALARLAGSHKAGRLADSVDRQFPFDYEKAVNGTRIPYSAEKLQRRITRYAEFARRYPQLLPANIRSGAFIERLAREAPRFLQHESELRHALHANSDLIALCHWNANSDNAWYWRDASGELQCGLLDWGSVGQMHLTMTLWGCLSGGEGVIWDEHLDELLGVFVAEFQRCGGPALDGAELKRQLLLQVALMGLAWLMDAPVLIEREIPDLAEATGRFDRRFSVYETSRVQLHIMTNFLNVWDRRDLGGLLEEFVGGCYPPRFLPR